MRGLSLVRGVAVAVVLAVSGCSGAGSSSAAPSELGSPAATGTPDATTGGETNASCPVTTSWPQGQVPTVLRDVDGHWHGTDGLWVDIWFPSSDGGPLSSTDDGAYRLKYATVTLDEGAFISGDGPPTVRARQINGPGAVRGSTGGYAHAGSDFEFWPTTFEFPSRGCWRVTTSWRDTTVTFTLQVPR